MNRGLICAALAAAVLAVGCGSGGGTASNTTGGTSGSTGSTGSGSSGKQLTIAVIPKGSTHEYWKSVHQGAEQAAKELGVNIIFKGPLKEDDRDSQVTEVDDFVTKHVDGIVLAPLDEHALVGPVNEATGAGIPVLIIDSALDGGKTVSFVATDNEKGGEMAGDYLGKILNGKGKVVMLRYEAGSASTEAREAGFLKAIAKYKGITIVSDNQHGGATVDSAQTASESLLAPYRQANGSLGIDGIFCPNESTASGMLLVLEQNNWAGKVKFVGFDSSDQLIKGLKAGHIDGLIVQNPVKMGYLGVKMLVDSIHGKTVDAHVDTGATLVTPQNMTQPDIAKLIAPPTD